MMNTVTAEKTEYAFQPTESQKKTYKRHGLREMEELYASNT